ncbi:MAG: sodium:solute symporter family protein [Saccharofermentanales bacterium]|jgi:SSS family solute:Na+ symporter
MSTQFYLGGLAVLLAFVTIGIFSGSKVKTAEDFSIAKNKASTPMIIGSLVGTLVGGASTVGTAQMAFTFGYSAFWFTLGAGLALILFYILYSKQILGCGEYTIPSIIEKKFGKLASTVIAILNSLGSFLSVVSQTLAGVALLRSILNISALSSVAIIIILMMIYVIFGGSLSTSYVGLLKTIVLYITVGICGLLAIKLIGGFSVMANRDIFPPERFFNLFARGFAVDIGSGLSMILGVFCTQIYVNILFSGKDRKTLRNGYFLSGILIPFAGLAAIQVGLYMHMAYPQIQSQSALPLFILKETPAWFSGISMAALILTIIGSGAGMGLGISSVLTEDIICKYWFKDITAKQKLHLTRIVLFALLIVASLITIGALNNIILDWSFLSMGLRAVATFAPFTAALLISREGKPLSAILSAGCGLVASILVKATIPTVNPIFIGIIVATVFLMLGYIRRTKIC